MSMRITRVKATHFRAVLEVDLALKPLTVVIGPNGAGKSTLLELIGLFGKLKTPGSLAQSIARWGGFGACVHYGAQEQLIPLSVGVSEKSASLDYELGLHGEGGSFFVQSERLTSRGLDQAAPVDLLKRTDTGMTWIGKNGESSVRVADRSDSVLAPYRTQGRHFETLLDALSRQSHWVVHKFQPSAGVRAPQQLQPAAEPISDGSNLFSVLYVLKTERRAAFLELLATLQAAVPELEELEFPLAGAGHVNLTWKQSNYSQPFYSNQLSDGILRFLWLATILHTAPDDGLVMIDEPELSLHPQWLMLLVSLMRKTAARTNVLVATQSAELVRWLQPEELVIAQSGEYGTTFERASDRADLDRWLKDFTLAELWTMGELGGRR